MTSQAGIGPANTTLGGIDIELLEPLERAVGVGDADSTATLLASAKTLPIGDNAAQERPLRRTILHWAAFGGNPDVVAVVLEAVASSCVAASAASKGVEGGTQAAADAAAAATSAALKARCLSGAGGPDGSTPLHLASKHGHVAAAIVLLDAGAVDSYADEWGRPPLTLAVKGGHDDMVAELLRRGSLTVHDPMDFYGATVLHLAAEKGHLGLVETFLRDGAEVNVIREPQQQTPLHSAAICGPNAEAITMALLAAGADVAAEDHFSESALCMTSDVAVVRALVAAGACFHWREGHGPPVEMAIERDDVEELSVFLELGVDPNHREPVSYPPLSDDASEDERIAHQSSNHFRRRYGGASLFHRASRLLGDGAVKLLLAAGGREDLRALENVHQPHMTAATLPADVIGINFSKMTPELQRRADAIKSMLAGAHLYRKGWLSVLRTRFDAGENLTGSDGEGRHSSGGGGSDGVGSPSPRRQKGERHVSGIDVAAVGVEDEVWYRAALWIASVPGPEVFRIIADYL